MVVLLMVLVTTLLPLTMAVIYFLGVKTGKEIATLERPVKKEKISKKEQKEQNEILEKFNKAWDNINDYDGSSSSQKEV